MDDCRFSDIDCDVIKKQIERREKYRKEFLKLRTDPCKHSQEAGYVVSFVLYKNNIIITFIYFLSIIEMYHLTHNVSNLKRKLRMECLDIVFCMPNL